MGDRVKFRENLNLYLEDLKRGHDDNNSCASTSSVTYLNLTSLPEDGTYFSELDSLVNFNNPSTSATQISSDTLIQNPSTHHDTPSFTPNEENVSTPRQSRTTSSSSTVDLTPSTSTDFPSGFVLNILQASFQGRTILEKGKAGALEPTDRKRLSNIIIQHILENCPNRRLCADQFCYLGSQIIQIFPEEFLSLYYVRYIQSSNSGNKKSAAGSLYDSYTTIRNKLKIEGHIKTQGKSKKRRNTSLSPQPSCSKDANVEDIEDQYINCEDLEYLRSSVYPWEVVVAKWKGTCNLRHKKLTGKSKAEGDSNLVGQYMNEFPALKQPNGFQLVSFLFKLSLKHYQFHTRLMWVGIPTSDPRKKFIFLVMKRK